MKRRGGKWSGRERRGREEKGGKRVERREEHPK